MPTPNVVALNAVSVTIDAAVTTPYSAGATQRARTSVPTRPMTRVARLVGSVHATPRIVRAVRLVGGALGDTRGRHPTTGAVPPPRTTGRSPGRRRHRAC